MRIYILKKSITDLKNPIVKIEYETHAETVEEFIREMVAKNYSEKRVKDTLDECCRFALDEFCDGSYYLVNKTRDVKYSELSESCSFESGDEVVLIKLKYLRGVIW